MDNIENYVLAHMAFKNVHLTRVWDDSDLKKWVAKMSDSDKSEIREIYKKLVENRKNGNSRK
jgi:hypothetical protein